ncbi:MAG: hypothetical protein A3A96_01950 [Candidatus Zambryskibacteria bacterium RIFCSPLOWO2_01_FULL_39_39]|uniref:Uncharacterized protein n=1 Tax=Candidatus Zambryskibacteria bacterium RIFCSPLOWO2_01_FULL_39_39 TaxID=1802758 RepID=A0A1G2TVT4_9BACT|nr:MAG: hypothetical protein A2644_02065 [Candidatus Zambryskibacteria bacterium RIFCSPHIGHO2_01_FULL_39_63]OHA94217.1 MAG: hypothetical protein A3B88_03650 [Candidatus Zambryskibacteria bacterium RIFCSPHIGHO2_02_FULL_39_19]OHA98516.1 MAG: hypothetical protein A3F20_03845 [Candidatus Zambryskibacteria bacterium RIFCSPHIGHO2_12_FULL_39_21]OHB01435.1 MAG: hypothetical protein A3A96_01950 [Candidatus Zambryskibacteria bacterium RIFCSPLOWO2_01_FULL_39_39]
MSHFVSGSCEGEKCRMCKDPTPATHKVGEEILSDDPNPIRHNLTAYVCCLHFGQIFGPVAQQACLENKILWDFKG